MPGSTPVLHAREGRYCVVEADLESGREPIGVLLEDPEHDRFDPRFRRDLGELGGKSDDILAELPSDLESKAAEMGAGALLSWLEENASNFIRVTERRSVMVDNVERTAERLYQRNVRFTPVAGTRVRLQSLKSAAGPFLENPDTVEEYDWIEVPEHIRITADMFAATIQGTSMEPLIPDGSVCLFRRFDAGSRRGKLVLVQEAGNRFTVKRYTSKRVEAEDGTWRHEAIVLEALNPEHEDIVLEKDEYRYRVIAEFIRILF